MLIQSAPRSLFSHLDSEFPLTRSFYCLSLPISLYGYFEYFYWSFLLDVLPIFTVIYEINNIKMECIKYHVPCFADVSVLRTKMRHMKLNLFLVKLRHVRLFVCLFVFGAKKATSGPSTSSFTRFLDHTQRRSTVGRTPLDEWSIRRRDLYLTTHDTRNRQNIHDPGGIRTHDLSRRAAADLRFRPRGHCDMQ